MKPNRKLQKEVKKDMVAYGIKDYQRTWSDEKDRIYERTIRILTISFTIAMMWAIGLSIATTIILITK